MRRCLSCFRSSKVERSQVVQEGNREGSAEQPHNAVRDTSDDNAEIPDAAPSSQTFTLGELASATNHFSRDSVLGEGGFGKVYKGRLENTGQEVAVKQLDKNGPQGNKEFLVEVLMLSLLHHPNLVTLIGCCAEGDQRVLVYEFMPLGSLEDHLHGRDNRPRRAPLDWNTRMKIAAGAAQGLEYLHHKAKPPVIFRDMKASNILLDEGFHPKLSDFGLAKLGPTGDKTHVTTQVMGTYGYCAPEYAMTGQLTVKSDVYSFGVVLLELISGRKALDYNRPREEQSMVAWARPLFKDRNRFDEMADPLLRGRFRKRSLYQTIAVAAMCLQEQAASRPTMAEVVPALAYLASQQYDPNARRAGPSNYRDHSLSNRPDNRQQASQVPSGDSANSKEKNPAEGTSYGAEDVKGEEAGKLGENSNVDELDRDRECAVEEENLRDKTRTNPFE